MFGTARAVLILSLAIAGPLAGQIPVPSNDILAWTKYEVGAFFHFNMQTFAQGVDERHWTNRALRDLPPASTFDPQQLDVGSWLDVVERFKAKYAILTVKHGSGFVLWPSDIAEATGFDYKYSVKYSPYKAGNFDVARDFVNSCSKYGVKPGFYYSLNNNAYLNTANGRVSNGSLAPGQVRVTQDEYEKIVLAQLKELWTNYGPLGEIWFDGGCLLGEQTCQMVEQLRTNAQPHAIAFQGTNPVNTVRWVGTESGTPGYPLWSTATNCAAGLGDPNGNTFCPGETDTTIQEGDQWFWKPNIAIRSLPELQQVYISSVGHNTNLLLNVPPNSSGLVDDSYAKRAQEFGVWVDNCFGTPRLHTSGTGYVIRLLSAAILPFQFNKLVIQEDQSKGESVQEFSVSYNTTGSANVSLFAGQSIGHKLIVDLNSTSAFEVLLNITKAVQTPVIPFFGLYNC